MIFLVEWITVVDGGVDDRSLERIWLSVPSRKLVNWVKSAPEEDYFNEILSLKLLLLFLLYLYYE